MNRHPDGTELETDELADLAKEIGVRNVDELFAALHGGNLYRSWLLQKTRDIRYELFGAGLLKLDTRTPKNTPA